MFDNVLVLSYYVHCTLLIDEKVVGDPLKPSKFLEKRCWLFRWNSVGYIHDECSRIDWVSTDFAWWYQGYLLWRYGRWLLRFTYWGFCWEVSLGPHFINHRVAINQHFENRNVLKKAVDFRVVVGYSIFKIERESVEVRTEVQRTLSGGKWIHTLNLTIF